MPARRAVTVLACFALLLASRLCHVAIIWVEEAYPAAGAIQMLAGKMIYRDFWFDKPPLSSLVYLLWGGYAGLPLRIAGAVLLTAACLLVYVFAERLWSRREAAASALLLAFFFTFDFPASALALAPDLLMTIPHIGAVYLAWRGHAFWSGVVAGVALQTNPKGIFVLAACLIWNRRAWPILLAGFAAANGAMFAWLGATGALPAYVQQVWEWGVTYSKDTFLAHPLITGFERTGSWVWFHLALVLGAILYFYRRERERLRMLLWMIVSMGGVIAGWRFFPRYYFLLLVPMTLIAARGFSLSTRIWRAVLAAALLIPLIRFGPRYVMLASDLLRQRPTVWGDVAMNVESRAAAAIVQHASKPGDTLLVWGYRPDVFVYTRMPAGTPFLDSQPLTGVIADRHLTDARPSAADLALRNRRLLTETAPTFVADGLGPYNPRLAITNYPDLRSWLGAYAEIARVNGFVIYRRR